MNSCELADIEPRLPTPTSAQVPGSSGASVIPVIQSVNGAMTVVPHVPGSVQVALAPIGSGCTQTAPPVAEATWAHNVSLSCSVVMLSSSGSPTSLVATTLMMSARAGTAPARASATTSTSSTAIRDRTRSIPERS